MEESLSPEQVAELHQAGDIELVDIREPHEWEAGHISGAKHIALAELATRQDEIARDRPLVLYCHMGSRSQMALQAFKASGYDSHHLEGGLEAWAERGLPLEPLDGSVAGH